MEQVYCPNCKESPVCWIKPTQEVWAIMIHGDTENNFSLEAEEIIEIEDGVNEPYYDCINCGSRWETEDDLLFDMFPDDSWEDEE